VCAGFAIFLLSDFPPTRRFGLIVVLGTLLAPLPAVLVVPWLTTIRARARSVRWVRRVFAVGAE